MITGSNTTTTPAEPTRGVWSQQEHDLFLEGLQRFPNGPWKLVSEHVGTRSVRQVQTHAQKYHEKVARRLRGLRKDRKRVQRPEHRIDDEMLEICQDLQRDSNPLPSSFSPSSSSSRAPQVTGILRSKNKTNTLEAENQLAQSMMDVHVQATEQKQEEEDDEMKDESLQYDHHHHPSQALPSSVMGLFHHYHHHHHHAMDPVMMLMASPSFDDCLDFFIEALSSSDSDSDLDEYELP